MHTVCRLTKMHCFGCLGFNACHQWKCHPLLASSYNFNYLFLLIIKSIPLLLRSVFLTVLKRLLNWQNTVLNRWHCMEKAKTKRIPLENDVKLGILLSIVSTIVGLKNVFMHLILFEFLIAISKFATYVIIWILMKRSNIEKIMDYLFCGLPWPFEILGQNSCEKIETSPSYYLKVRKRSFWKNSFCQS